LGSREASAVSATSARRPSASNKTRKKKVKWFTTFGTVEIEEQILRLARPGRLLRPFCEQARVKAHGYSRRLQRVLVDFGAESSFHKSVERVKEHYGITVPVAGVREHTLRHGRAIISIPSSKDAKACAQLITQMDGSMIPVMQRGSGADGRQGKTLFWREVKLCCARRDGQSRALYAATLGSAETAAWVWQEIAQAAGLKPKTHVHGIGDGAPWILEKFTDNFGRQGSYLLDFYHVSQYLAAAAPPHSQAKQKQWLHRQQSRLLNNQTDKVLRDLERRSEPKQAPESPVRSAHDYIANRREHLGYQKARHNNLPIGSGEIESGHGHVVQDRLKLSGCWWKETNAAAMLNLRVARANSLWHSHWLAANN
jgi:hypothetical protein